MKMLNSVVTAAKKPGTTPAPEIKFQSSYQQNLSRELSKTKSPETKIFYM